MGEGLASARAEAERSLSKQFGSGDRLARLLALGRDWTLASGAGRNWTVVEALLRDWDASIGISRQILRMPSPTWLGKFLGTVASEWERDCKGRQGNGDGEPDDAVRAVAGPPSKVLAREKSSLSESRDQSAEENRIFIQAHREASEAFESAFKAGIEAVERSRSLAGALLGTLYDHFVWTIQDMRNFDLVVNGLNSPLRSQSALLREAVGHGLYMLGVTRTTLLPLMKPRLHRDNNGRLHNETGPAISWDDPDDRTVQPHHGCFYLHGVAVDDDVILEPNALTPRRILATANIEQRRVYIERFGMERMLTELGERPSRSDRCGRLWRLKGESPDPLVVVEVVCPSTDRKYLIQVPPDMKSPKAAVAWTFGLGEREYRPQAET